MMNLGSKYFLSVAIVFFMLSIFFTSETRGQGNDAVDSSKKNIDLIFSIGGGVARFMGDVQDAPDRANVHLLGNRAVFGFHFGAAVSRSLTISTNMFYGKLSGNENTFGQNRNFETNMLMAGVVAEYNFAGLYKYRLPVVNPFINAGLYYGNYWNISTDLSLSDGTQYNYWSDGTIKDEEQTGNELLDREANNISRDYTYESSLVEGTLHTFNVGAGFGLDLHLSRAVTVRLMSRYFFSTNDKVDGHYEGDAKGLNDGFFYNSLSLVFNAMAFSPNRRDEKPNYKYLFDVSQLSTVEQEDRDGDGILDFEDRCAATPKGIEVDAEGCPLDADVDGIPDYRDKNTASSKGEIVDQNGVAIDYKLIAERWNDSPNVYGISWDKDYGNPRFREDLGYTVNVDVTETSNRSPQIQKVLLIPELRKEVLNDSLIVYRLGVYEKYEDVELRRQQLVDDGIYSGYSVPENASLETVQQFTKLPTAQDQKLIHSYGVKESIQTIKTTTAYGFPQLDYTVSRFERYLFENVPEAALVEDYLQAISAFMWDDVVKQSSDTVYARLEKYPVPDFIKRVESGLANQEFIAEPNDDAQKVGKATPEAVGNQDETPDEPSADASESKTDVAEPEDVEMNEKVEENLVVKTEVLSETLVEESGLSEPTETEQQTIGDEASSYEEIIPVALTGKELQKAIEQIRSTSNLNKQPRIDYAPVKSEFKGADLNGDQLISAHEIQQVLDDILKGRSEFTETQFNEMNAYFTEFTQNVEPIDFGGTKVAFVNGKLTILKTQGGEYEENSRRLLARKYKEADFDKDGELTTEEVQKMIDLFIKGGSPYSQEKVHELIDLYFD